MRDLINYIARVFVDSSGRNTLKPPNHNTVTISTGEDNMTIVLS